MRLYPIYLALIFCGCNGAVHSDSEPAPVPFDAVRTDADALLAQRRASGFVVKYADKIVEYAMRFARSDDLTHAIRSLLDDASSGGSSLHLLQPDDLKAFYAGRGHAPVFVESSRISPHMKALEEELLNLDAHGLKIDSAPWLASREALMNSGEDGPGFRLTPSEKTALIDVIVRDGVDLKDGRAVRKMIAGLVDAGTPVPRLRKAVSARAARLTLVARHAARTEILTADLALRFSRAMTFDNMSHLTKEEKKLLGKDPTAEKYATVAGARAVRWLGEIARVADLSIPGVKTGRMRHGDGRAGASGDQGEADDKIVDRVMMLDGARDDADAARNEAAAAREAKILELETVDELVNALYPPHPGYRQLMAARKRYLSMEDWEPVPHRLRLVPGTASDIVPALKRRLSAEGYYHGQVLPESRQTDDYSVYDNDVRAAVRVYYDTHQLAHDENAGLLPSFWKSLNTPRTVRLAQIEENLRRWHRTRIIESPYYIFINVPDFYGEIWRDGKMTYRFPVVVGNAKRECDPQTRLWKYVNATPLMHARMLYVEYNPYWNVPARIEQEDYIRKINADPTWLETHGFEYHTENGYTVLRQLPSEKNALGRVKFIFPNPHSTFMHDTPNKGMFRYPIRAFSHGCMRVAGPLELARRIMQYDGQWYDGLDVELEDMQMRRFVLKTRFDVFIDYFTVKVSEDGMVHFLADPYRYVKYALNPPPDGALECIPEPKTWISRGHSVGSGSARRPQEEDVGAEMMDLSDKD